jgi:hypothetical protein
MALDIYLRLPQDPNYNANFLEVEDDISNFVQMIEMMLTTVPGEVLGEPELGCNLEGYLWNPYITVGTIKNDIMSQIRRFCNYSQLSIPFNVNVNFIKGDVSDSILVDIEIDGRSVLGIAASPNPDTQISLNV